MKKSNQENNCQIHMMPTSITDQDINALFNGIIAVVRKKYELDTKSHLMNINNNLNRINQELSEKRAECNRLKNEILYLKTKLEENNINY